MIHLKINLKARLASRKVFNKKDVFSLILSFLQQKKLMDLEVLSVMRTVRNTALCRRQVFAHATNLSLSHALAGPFLSNLL